MASKSKARAQSTHIAGDRLSRKVYDAILSEILSGMFSEGDRLPTEARLAERFDVSRPVVREALAHLRDDGMVKPKRGSGSYVQQRPTANVLRFAPLASIADIQRCFEFREAIEPAAASLAAHRHSSEQLVLLAEALEVLDLAVEAGSLGVDADFGFHKAVAEASGNSFFEQTLISLEAAARSAISVNRNLSLIDPQGRLKTVQAEHVEVYEAINGRDAPRAEAAMRRHIQGARRRIFEGK